MPLILFWLVPVILVIVLITIILHDQETRSQPKLLLFDPLVVVESWKIARVLGNEQRVLENLAMVTKVLPGTATFMEDFLKKLEFPRATVKGATLQKNTRVGSYSELYQFQHSGRIISLLLGDIGTVSELCDQSWQGAVNEKVIAELEHEDRLTRQHGYFGLAVAIRLDRSLPGPLAPYQLLGYLICEPALNQAKISKLRQAEAGKKARVITLLSLELAENLAKKVFPSVRWQSLSALTVQATSPKGRRSAFEKATLIADTTLNDRHEICLLWRHTYQLELAASHPEDVEHLPCKIIKI